ncbi:hypothetical protein [Streptomyces sp. 769]|uniref:hypothetical protein n=1 Tax=Streptomyces sp. 769 TaxID=1262452 RepID=UPI000581E573|nr:hypothetical protein [Streptomyces sp. 769]AJC62057.1 hypothetical protein GZL_p00127 [Streptomyces sp. 769]
MVPEVLSAGRSESLAGYLDQYLNLPLDFASGQLDVERIADVAVLAVAHSEAYGATGRLVNLLAGLPVPSDEPRDFWFRLWQASGSPIFMPPNINFQVLAALRGSGVALADQLLTAVSEMNDQQRSAAVEVIGDGLLESIDIARYKAARLGELWLRDVEMTAWRVLYADRTPDSWEAQEKFRKAWKGISDN